MTAVLAAAQPTAEPALQQTADLDDLRERMRPVCATAVDALEVAANLESDGLNDAGARAHGHRDVFALAQAMYTSVARTPGAVAVVDDRWRSRALHHVLRGALFGLPGLCYVAASQSLGGPGVLTVIVVSLLLSWTFGEGMASLGLYWVARLDQATAARVLRRSLTVGVVTIVPAIVALGVALDVRPLGTAFAAGQAGYLLSATVLLALRQERWLLAALTPGVVGCGVSAVVPGLEGLAWVSAALTVLATDALAVTATGRRGEPRNALVTAAGRRTATQHALFGLLAGGLLAVTALRGLEGAPAMTMIALPLSLTMGIAELVVYRYRRRTFEALQAATSLRGFAVAARWRLAVAVGGYLVALGAVATALSSLAGVAGTEGLDGTAAWTAITLGGCLFMGLVLRSCEHLGPVLIAFAAGLAGELVLLWAVGGGGGLVQAAACGALLAGLVGYGMVALSRAATHR